MESLFRKAVSPATVLKRTTSEAFSSEYTYFNIFAHCFILSKPSLFDLSLFGFRIDQNLFNRPSYFNSQNLVAFEQRKVNKKKHVRKKACVKRELLEIGA